VMVFSHSSHLVKSVNFSFFLFRVPCGFKQCFCMDRLVIHGVSDIMLIALVARRLCRSSLSLLLTTLDFGNATLASIPSFQLDRLQAVMNAVARLVFQCSRHDHITPLLYRLHWLRAPERIAYKLAVLVYQCVHGLAPAYLTDALHSIQPVAGLPGRQRLRSSSTSALAVPLTRLSTIGDRAFPVAAARTCNSLPPEVTSSQCL